MIWMTLDKLVHVVTRKIDTRSAAPIKQSLYRTAPSVCEFVRKEIEKLKDKGLIKDSKSP